jgi:nucleoside-diphosphate-sugar epimerase
MAGSGTSASTPPTGRSAGRVLVTGASGFVGRAVVRALADAGFEVHGLVRDPAKGERVRESGGIPFHGAMEDRESLATAVRGCAAAIHLAANPSRDEDPYQVRVEGVRHLIEAGRPHGLRRLVVGSGYWVYRGQATEITEETEVDPQGESRVNFETERAALTDGAAIGLEVVVVRPGMIYGDGSWFRGLASAVRSGEYAVVGDGANRWSFAASADTASAFQRVLAAGRPGEVYNVADNASGSYREFVDFVAARLGVNPPGSISLEEAESEMGEVVARHLAADRAMSSAKLQALGWSPRFVSYREGVPNLLREMFPRGAGR